MNEENNKSAEVAAAEPAAAPATEAAIAKPAAAAKKPAARAAAVKTSRKPAAKPAPAVKAKPAATKAAPARKRSVVDETVDKHQKELADALQQAEAIHYDKSKHIKPATKAGKAAKQAKSEKPGKARKSKLIRDSFAMPEGEYALIGELKKRLAGEYKKSEVLRAGIIVLAALNDSELKAVMGHIERIKTGRPSKK